MAQAHQGERIEFETAEDEETSRRGPRGIGGWLIVPFLTLVVVAFAGASSILDGELSRVSQEFLAGNLILIVASVALMVLFLQQSELVPMLMVVFYVVLLGINVLEYVAIDRLMFGVTEEIADKVGMRVKHDLRHVIGIAIIWIPYFLVSKRVKNTFVR